ncbi:MAG: hypothetical protein N2588_04465 [Rhodovarius sp.]|nr:hypothetical protein [Rhodovarius sp.]
MTVWRPLLLLAAFALAIPAGSARAAAWTHPAGSGLFIGTAAFTTGDRYLRSGGSAPVPSYTKVEDRFLIEYGLTDWITAIAMPSLRWTRAGGAPADVFFGLGYTDLGARVRLWQQEASVFSFQVLGRIPGARDDGRRAQFGNTAGELDLRLLFGHGFSTLGRPAFVNLEAAYRLRFRDPPDEFRFDATYGWRPVEHWLLLAQSFTVASHGAGQGAYGSSWYTRVQLSAAYEWSPGWWLQAGGLVTLAGHNALRENGAILALWRRF